MSTIRATVVAVLVGVASPASAGEFDEQDGRAVADDRVFEIFAGARAGKLTLDEAKTAIAAMRADGSLSPAEIDLIDELVASEVRTVNIRRASGEAGMATLGTQWDDVRDAFEAAIKDQFATLLAGGISAQSWESLVRHSRRSAAALARVRSLMDTKALAAVQGSNVANVYRPARDLIANLSDANKALPAELQDPGRWLIFPSFEKADSATGGLLPDMIYGFMKPSV